MAIRTWAPGSRLKRLRASHSYGWVLLLIVVTYVVIVAPPDRSATRGTLVFIQSVTLATALWASGLAPRRPAVILVALGTALAFVQAIVGGSTLSGIVALTSMLLVAATMVVIGLGVFDQHEVNRQSVGGAVCIYLLLGILFTFLYTVLAVLGSGDFFAQGTDGSGADRVYFSYVTLATLGYGDYTPKDDLGHTLAIVEALFGQIYLVTVVALLVARLRPRREPAG
jgi:Ion channel